jgi:hypothetical protein
MQIRALVGCYQLFARAGHQREDHAATVSIKASKKASFLLLDKPVFKAVLGASWKSLAESSSIDDATPRLLIPVAPVLEVLPLDDTRGFGLRWKTSCPCCFYEMIPEPKVGLIEEKFANLRHKVTKETVILRDCPALDKSTGEEVTKTIMVHVVTVEPVVSTATASQFRLRSSDENEHRGYEVAIPKMPTVTSKVGVNEVDEGW